MSTFEFDSTYSALTGQHVGGLYVPTVEHSDEYDVLIEGNVTRGRYFGSEPRPQWDAVTGYTGQHGYSGAVFHPSESATDEQVREWVREAGGDVFAIVEVRDEDGNYPEGDPIGWAIIYRAAV